MLASSAAAGQYRCPKSSTHWGTGMRRRLMTTTTGGASRAGLGGPVCAGSSFPACAVAKASCLLSAWLRGVTWSPTTRTNSAPRLAKAPLCMPRRALPNNSSASSGGRWYVYLAHSCAPRRTDQFNLSFNSTSNQEFLHHCRCQYALLPIRHMQNPRLFIPKKRGQGCGQAPEQRRETRSHLGSSRAA